MVAPLFRNDMIKCHCERRRGEAISDKIMKKKLKIITRDFRYSIDYHYSYGEFSPFFEGLKKNKLMGSFCRKCKRTYATPRMRCMICDHKTWWAELPLEGKVHTWTTCYYGSEEFIKQTPFHLALIQFDGVDTLFLTQLKQVKEGKINIGMNVKAKFKNKLNMKASDIYFVPA